MLFNSYTFLAFYAIVFASYFALRRSLRAQNGLLLIASYAFYSAWDYRFLALILLSTVVDFVVARKIEHHRDKGGAAKGRGRRWLILSLVVNLGSLAIFKYLNFAVDSFCALSEMVGLPLSVTVGKIILPVGISFFTFQTLSYTIDVYRGRVKACRDPLAFAVYVAFFPQLVAGPIERATHFLPQVLRSRSLRRVDFAIGTQFVLYGYFLKVVLADSIAPLVDQYYADPARYGGSIAWIANLGFAVQIYGDFCGYSLIARGISRWMGFRLMSNFRQPYLATSPRDFWTRWHRSLSLWLRRYLYFELGGSRHGMTRTVRNLMITMALGGLWHGASWNFVLWGIFHGLLLACEHWWIAARPFRTQSAGRAWKPLQRVATFSIMIIGWTLFRCESTDELSTVFTSMFAGPFADHRAFAFLQPVAVALAILLAVDVWKETKSHELVFLRAHPMVRTSLYVFFVIAVMAVGFRPTSFIYFQF